MRAWISATTLLAAMCALLPATGARAEEELHLLEPAARQGFYVGGGFRFGGAGIDSDKVGSLGATLMNGFDFRAGQMANDWIGFGLAIQSGGGKNDTWQGGFGALSLELTLIPVPTARDFALRGTIGVGGIGVSRVKVEDKTDDDPTGTAGALYTVGFSYDFFPWRDDAKDQYESGGLGLTFFVEAVLLPGDGLNTFGGVAGMELTYYFGFNKTRLVLPPSAY